MVLQETQRASCPPSAAIEFAGVAIAALAKERFVRVTEDQSYPIVSCRMIVDATDVNMRSDALKLDWADNASFLLPNFDGVLTFRPAFLKTDLTLEGSFESQSGSRRDSLDELALAITRSAMRSVLGRIVTHVEAQWISFSATCPTIEMCNARRSSETGSARSAAGRHGAPTEALGLAG